MKSGGKRSGQLAGRLRLRGLPSAGACSEARCLPSEASTGADDAEALAHRLTTADGTMSHCSRSGIAADNMEARMSFRERSRGAVSAPVQRLRI
jgi:hypothetical protein